MKKGATMTFGDWVMVLGLSAWVAPSAMCLSKEHPWLWALGIYAGMVALGLAITLSLK